MDFAYFRIGLIAVLTPNFHKVAILSPWEKNYKTVP